MLASCAIVLLLSPRLLHAVTHAMVNGGIVIPLVFAGTWVLCLLFSHTYQHHVMSEGYSLYAKILTALLAELVVLCSVGFIANVELPRRLVVIAPLIACVATCIERWLMRRALHANRRKGECMYSTLIVGSPQAICHAIRTLTSEGGKALGYKPVAVCPIAQAKASADADAAQFLVDASFDGQQLDCNLQIIPLNAKLPQIARSRGVSVVLITDVLTRDSETMRTLSLAVESLNMELAVTAAVADLGSGHLVLRSNTSMPVLSADLPQYSWPVRCVKRLIDIVVAFIALIPASIVMIGAAIAIKFEDGGPVLYKQERIGLHGKPFQCLKLRSMRVHADKMDAALAQQMGENHGILFKPKNDPRITRVGRIIRKTSIDELPQLINVLRGDMSLVGPRPQQRYEVEQYGPLYSTRLLVKPGITGPWQISGRSNLSQADAEFLDVNYVENWSLMTDLAILIKTVAVVIRGSGAY
nr:sugar transferase [Bifidobacterium colobi]